MQYLNAYKFAVTYLFTTSNLTSKYSSVQTSIRSTIIKYVALTGNLDS